MLLKDGNGWGDRSADAGRHAGGGGPEETVGALGTPPSVSDPDAKEKAALAFAAGKAALTFGTGIR